MASFPENLETSLAGAAAKKPYRTGYLRLLSSAAGAFMHFMTLLAAATPCLIASVVAGAAAARELEAASAVVAVVVHPDAATVTREATVDLPAGASTVLIKGGPFSIIPNSLRASGEARTPLTIGAVEERVAPPRASNRRTRSRRG